MTKNSPTTPTTALVRKVLRREFSAFFTNMLTPEPGWPGVSDSDFVDALADSVMAAGQRSGKGIGMLQTLVIELQEKINAELAGAR
jgi:hypothetical protein